MMRFAETQGDDFCVAWCRDGKSFIINNCDEFTRNVVPKFFKPTKFSSFTRKLYRWGFRQINRGLGPDDPVIFGCAYFQRNAPEEMAHMRSITAAAARKDSVFVVEPSTVTQPHQAPILPGTAATSTAAQPYTGSKRTLEDAFQDDTTATTLQKRLLLSKLLQQQTLMQQQSQHQSALMFPGMNPNSALALAAMQHHPRALPALAQQQAVGHSAGRPKNAQLATAAAYQNLMTTSTNSHPGRLAQLQSFQQFMGYPSSTSEPARTADIVNAAIAALRNA